MIDYILPICPEAHCGRICTKFGISVGLAGVTNCDKFLGDWSMGINSVGGHKSSISMTKPVAVNVQSMIPNFVCFDD